MSQRVLIPIAMAVLAALGLLACGGGGDDKQAIKRAAERSITTKDANLKCEQLATKSFVTRVYGDIAQCRTAERPSGDDQPPPGARASGVKVDGDSATVKVRITGGKTDGASGTIDVRKEGGDWRVDDLGVDLLRSQLRTGFAQSDPDSDPELQNPKVRECATKAFLGLADRELRRVAYMAIAETDEGKAQAGRLLGPCLALPSGGSGSVSILRRKFEDGITSSARKDGVSQSTIDCINKRLRSSISDDEIAKLAINRAQATPAIRRNTAEAFGRCQRAAGS